MNTKQHTFGNSRSYSVLRYGVTSVLLFSIVLSSIRCVKKDNVVGTTATQVAAPAAGASSTLTSIKITNALNPDVVMAAGPTSALTMSGALDPAWNNAPNLVVKATVPDVEGPAGSNGFAPLIGNSTTVTMQSLYDNTYVYFLVQWNEAAPHLENSPWYYNTTTHTWATAGAAPTYDVNGNLTMQSYVSDQFVALFNINNSCADFTAQSCYGACHQNVAARFYQVLNQGQGLDYYLDNDGGVYNGSGIHADGSISNGANPPTYASNVGTNGPGSVTNKQTLKYTSVLKGTVSVSVPIWIKTNDTYSNCGLLPSDTANTAANYGIVVAVDSMGRLSYASSRGGSVVGVIDPTVSTNYQLQGTAIAGAPNTWIPSKIYLPYTGGEGDVMANAHWTGTGWQLMLKRKLNTGDALLQDINFATYIQNKQDVQFGIGVMFQAPGNMPQDNEHAIVPGLTLHFQQ